MLKFNLYVGPTLKAHEFSEKFQEQYKNYPVSESDVCVVVGGDGTLLRALHDLPNKCAIFPVNTGKVGFLMNQNWKKLDILEDLVHVTVRPLVADIKTSTKSYVMEAYNDISIRRHGPLAAHLGINVNKITGFETLVGDGLIVSTPMGSTGYNHSAGGPILPLGSNVLSMVPICPFSPRQWKGSVIPQASSINISVQNSSERPASITCDTKVLYDVVSTHIHQDHINHKTLLFDPAFSLEERVLRTQFQYNT